MEVFTMVYKKDFKSSHGLLKWTVVLILSCLLAISMLMWWNCSKPAADVVLHHDIEMLSKIFAKMHKDCYILDFKHTKNHIDFLNVIHFVGSEVGSARLAFAKNWQDPYLKNNPQFHEKLYAILKNKHGFFIIPADGVVLSNGKEIGKDIILNEHTDMRRIMRSSDGLLSSSGVLAAPIQVGSRTFAQMAQDPALFQSID